MRPRERMERDALCPHVILSPRSSRLVLHAFSNAMGSFFTYDRFLSLCIGRRMGTTILTLSVILLLISTSQSTSNVVRGNDDVANERAAYLNDRREHTEYTDDGRVIEIITMGDIDAMMRLENFENVASGGLRKLEDDTCWHGGQDNQVLQWLVRSGPAENHLFRDDTLAHSILFCYENREILGGAVKR